MTVRSLPAALALGLAFLAAEARAQQHNPLHFNNPLNQGGMYNVSSGPLRFNNPVNQTGMYGSDPVLRFNNPLAQAGMYASDPVLRFNNPLNQGNAVPGGFNNPLTQGNSVPGGFNNPLTQGNGVGAGTGANNTAAQNTAGVNAATGAINNGNIVGAASALNGGFLGGFNGGAVGFGNGFYGGAVGSTGFDGFSNLNGFGWGGGVDPGFGFAGMNGGADFNTMTPVNTPVPTGRGFSSKRVHNPDASATLNGLNGAGKRSSKNRAPSRKPTSRKKK